MNKHSKPKNLEKEKKENPPARVSLLDSVRGLSVVLMIAYHMGYNLWMHNFVPSRVMFHPVLNVLQIIFAAVFITISGIASCYSRSNLRRGLRLFLVALGITLVTSLIDVPVLFGVLHFLSISMIIYALSRKFWDKIPARIGAPLFLAAFLTLQPHFPMSAPGNISWLFPLGFRVRGFFSADYFPLITWFFVFLLGCSLGKPLLEGRAPKWVYGKKEDQPKPLAIFAWIGQRALLVYLLHQPVLYGITLLLEFFLRR